MELVLKERHGEHVVHLIMNDPDKMNALGGELVNALTAALKEANDDQSVKVIVLSGNGRSFSSGGDVQQMHTRTGMFAGSPAEIRHNYMYGLQTVPRLMNLMEVPVIAAVHGYAVGGGADLAGACDIRFAADNAVFSERFVKLGLIAGDGGCWIWPRLVGPQHAYRMALTGDFIKADEAKEMGMVLDVVPQDKLLETAFTLADRIAENSGPAVRATKRLIREGKNSSLEGSLDLAASIQGGLHYTPEHREAVEKIIEGIEERKRMKNHPGGHEDK